MAAFFCTVSILPLAGADRKGDNRDMFAVYCSGHGSRVLLFSEHIEELVNCPEGMHVRWRCTCGTMGKTLIPRNGAPLEAVA